VPPPPHPASATPPRNPSAAATARVVSEDTFMRASVGRRNALLIVHFE